MLIPILYWVLITALSLFTFKKIFKHHQKKISLKNILKRILFLFSFIYARIYFPLIVSIFLYFIIFICGVYILYVINSISLSLNFPKEGINIPLVAYGYTTMTITSIVYAHSNWFKKIYSVLLKYFSLAFSIPFGFDTFDKVSKDLLRKHVYILLALIYFTVNALDFSEIIDKDQFSFITESLLTFVIVDTAIVINRDQTKN